VVVAVGLVLEEAGEGEGEEVVEEVEIQTLTPTGRRSPQGI